MIRIRPLETADLTSALSIIRQTQEIFRTQGIDQWQNGYPNLQTLQHDLAHSWGRVLEEDGQTVAYFALSFDGEPNYRRIENGSWLTPGPYSVLHRLAVRTDKRRAGYAKQICHYWEAQTAERKFTALRADTHKNNRPMTALLLSQGFSYRGVIYVSDGTPRNAFEKPLH
ncbi:MAG: GNAT family N-acetyltransferase [Elusimicrobiales bacterium]|nr:GNAT family N-acetyltransferase [Elusimicrobiales bacterium]